MNWPSVLAVGGLVAFAGCLSTNSGAIGDKDVPDGWRSTDLLFFEDQRANDSAPRLAVSGFVLDDDGSIYYALPSPATDATSAIVRIQLDPLGPPEPVAAGVMPSLGPSGTLYFQRNASVGPEIYARDVRSGSERLVYDMSDQIGGDRCRSLGPVTAAPDSDAIAWTLSCSSLSAHGRQTYDIYDIYLLNASGARQFADGETALFLSGGRLLVASTNELALYDTTTGQHETFATFEGEVKIVRSRDDGETLFVATHRTTRFASIVSEIVHVDASGDPVVLAKFHDYRVISFDVSPNERVLAIDLYGPS